MKIFANSHSRAILLLLAGLLVSGGVAGTQSTADVKVQRDTLLPVSARKTSPDFTLDDAHGKPVTMSALKGKVVLLDFWATWCGGCKLEIPWYMEFDQKYKPQGLAVVGVAMDEGGWKAVRPFLALEKDPETGGHTAMPMTVLIDREGRIALSHTGVVEKDDFEAHIQQLLR